MAKCQDDQGTTYDDADMAGKLVKNEQNKNTKAQKAPPSKNQVYDRNKTTEGGEYTAGEFMDTQPDGVDPDAEDFRKLMQAVFAKMDKGLRT